MESDQAQFEYFFHLKDGTTKPAETSGLLYRTLCGHWVYDSIATDADCADRWVTCPSCSEKDPHPMFRTEVPAAMLRRVERE
jgi:hypothetical protein